MSHKRIITGLMAGLLALVIGLSVWSFVGAQDNSAKPFLGIGVQAADTGVQVASIQAGSPAEKAGLKVDDVITALDGKAVTADTIRDVLSTYKVGDTVKLSVTRGSDKMELSATLVAAPEATPEANPAQVNPPPAQTPVLGVALQEDANGVSIGQVVPGSAADKAGLKAGDIIVKINDTDVKTASAAADAIHAMKVGDTVSIAITRDGKDMTVQATLEAGSVSTQVQINPPITAQTPVLGVELKEGDSGPVIGQVVPGSAAEKAGLKADDIITKVGDTDVKTVSDAANAIRAKKIGDTVTLTITRDGKSQTVDVTLAAGDTLGQPQINPVNPAQPSGQTPVLGVALQDGTNGITIGQVVPGSAADKAGLKVGDIITRINDTDVKSASDAANAIHAMKVGDSVSIAITRDGKDMTVQATLEAGSAQTFQSQQPGNAPFNGIGIAYNNNDQTWEIRALSQDSALYQAGLRQGDVIKTFDGKSYDPSELATYLQGLDKTQDVTLSVERNGAAQDMKVTADQLSGLTMFGFGNGGDFVFPFGGLPFNQNTVRLGVQFVTLDAQTAKEHNVTQTDGALITQVMADTPAAKAGLQANDIVTAVDSTKLDATHTLRDMLSGHKAGDTLTLDVLRDGKTQQISATLDQGTLGDQFPFNFNFGQDGNGNGFSFPFPFPFPGPNGNGQGVPQQNPVGQPNV